MTKVGMYKQEKYDQGVEKLQSYFDNVIGGMDIANEADRQYAQSLINKVGSDMKWLVGGDFSNQQLVNSVGNMASQITKDPNVLNAVSSTALYRQGRAKIQKDIDEGKANPANIDAFDEQAAPWLNSKKVGGKFNGQYTPFFDVDKFVKEQFDAVKPGKYTFDELYQQNDDGSYTKDARGNYIASPVMKKMIKEGRLPKEVEGTINQIMADPRVNQQLQITGRYNYKGYAPQTLIDMVYDQRDTKLGGYLDKLAELNLDKKLGKDVQKDIDTIQANINTINSSYDKLAQQANDNPNGLKGYLYKQGVVDNYRSIYGSVRTSVEDVKNPLWEANFEMQKEANEQSRFAQKLTWDKTNAREGREFTAEQNRLNRASDKEIALLKGKGGKAGSSNNPFSSTANLFNGGARTYNENSSAVNVIENANLQLAKAGENFLNSSYGFVWDAMFSGDSANEKVLADDMKKYGITDREVSIKRILTSNAKAAKMSLEDYVTQYGAFATERVTKNLATATPSLVSSLNNFKAAQKEYTGFLNENKYINEKASVGSGIDLEKLAKGGNVPNVDVNFQGKKYTITNQDFADAAIYLAGNKSSVGDYTSDQERSDAKAAEARLRARGKAFILPTVLDRYGMNTTGTIDPITNVVRGYKSFANEVAAGIGVSNDFYLKDNNGNTIGNNLMGGAQINDPFRQSLNQAYGLIHNDKVTAALTKKAELLKKSTFFNPQMKQDVLTGDAETDRDTYNKLKTIAGNYITSGKNYADISDVKGFYAGITQDKPDVVEAQTFEGPNGESLTQYITFGANGISGRVVVANDEANNVGVNLSDIYEPPVVTGVRREIAINPNRRTSILDPNSIETYHNADAYFMKTDFPRMTKSSQGQDLKANFKFQNNLWFPIVYAKDASGREGVLEFEGEFELNTAVKKLQSLGPEIIPAIINK
jgi:hypothetical protein